MYNFSEKLLSHALRTCVFAGFLATSLHATPITGQSLNLSWYTPEAGSNGVSGSDSVLDSGEISQGGWVGSASFITNTSLGSDFTLPFTVRLTNLSMTCMIEDGCGYLEFDFSLNLQFDDAPILSDDPIPFTVSLDGSGPSAGFRFSLSSSFLSSFSSGNEIPSGEYNFGDSGFLNGNISSPSGNETTSKGNQSLNVAGYFGIGGGSFLQTVSLPHSFDTQVGDSAETPEPATLALSGAFLTAIGVWVRRRKSSRS